MNRLCVIFILLFGYYDIAGGLWVQPATEAEQYVGASFAFNCSSQYPKKITRWLDRQGNQVGSMGRVSTRQNNNGTMLHFTEVAISDTGIWKCSADGEKSIEVNMLVREHLRVRVRQTWLDRNDTIQTNLSCEMESSWDPSVRFELRWFQDSVSVSFSIGRQLAIIVPSEQCKETIYTCRARMFWKYLSREEITESVTIEEKSCRLGCEEKTTVLVDVEQGMLRGKKMTGADGTRYNTFLGIPYAQQPVGRLRFEPPTDPKLYDDIWDATAERASCLQSDYLYGSLHQPRVTEAEACLYLNVHVPAQRKSPVPIFVFMHGGSFSFGSGDTDIYGPDFLVSKDVMVVTFNYRTNVFGFLSLDTAEAPGNMGLRDALAALRWVKNNAAVFGGDPTKVTFGGQGAGGVGAHLLALSPLSMGLFHRTIAMSGNALSSWSMSTNNRKSVHQLVEFLGTNITEPHEIYMLLKAAKASSIMKAVAQVLSLNLYTSFVPVIEKRFEGFEPVISEDPFDVAVSGRHSQLPLMLGFTDRECIIFARIAVLSFHQALVPADIKEKLVKNTSKLSQIKASIVDYFFGNRTSSKSKLEQYIDWCSSALIGYKTIVAARLFANVSRGPTYFYQFSFDGEGAVFKKSHGLEFIRGASDCEDLSYLFKINSYQNLIVKGSLDEEVRILMTTLWTNFIKYGNPTPYTTDWLPNKWEASTSEELSYYYINSVPFMKKDPYPVTTKFWDQIYDVTSQV